LIVSEFMVDGEAQGPRCKAKEEFLKKRIKVKIG
jgi:hypothetical protein